MRFLPSLPFSDKNDVQEKFFWAGVSLCLLLFLVSYYTEKMWMMALPFGVVLAWLCVTDFKQVFYLLLFCIPFSMEQELPGGLATDLPDEPLMWLLTGIFGVFALRNWPNMRGSYLRHPLTIILLIHISWMMTTIITSGNVMISVKFWLAKMWYVITFFFLAGHILRTETDGRKFFRAVFSTLFIMILVTLARHAAEGFSFDSSNHVLYPFFRNHVNYAAIISLFIPFVWWATTWYRRFSPMWWLVALAVLIFMVGIQFSYTRAAYVSVVAAFGTIYIVRYCLMKYVLMAGFAALIWLVAGLVRQDNYLEHAPEFKKTITHHNFDNLLEATAKGEDISTMERVYRWVAGYHMARTSPAVGFGPGNFYNFYTTYAVSSFKTYVSDNPEHSGIHSYFLMTLVEQGFPGLLIFLILTAAILMHGERIYHQSTDLKRRRWVLALILSTVAIDCILLINDMIETDKVGPFFFMNIAMLINADLENKKENTAC